MQTWEYAPQYALRTYAYLVPMAALSKMYELILSVLPGSFLGILGRSLSLPYVAAKPLQFCMLRSTLAAMTALSERIANMEDKMIMTQERLIPDWVRGRTESKPAPLSSRHYIITLTPLGTPRPVSSPTSCEA